MRIWKLKYPAYLTNMNFTLDTSRSENFLKNYFLKSQLKTKSLIFSAATYKGFQ